MFATLPTPLPRLARAGSLLRSSMPFTHIRFKNASARSHCGNNFSSA